MDDRWLLINIAQKHCQKELEKAQRAVNKVSDTLATIDHANSSVRKRANLRTKLSVNCEERDRWQRRIEEAEKWKEELR